MSRVAVIMGNEPPAEALSPVQASSAPTQEFQAIIREAGAELLHSGLAPSWAKGGTQTLASLAAFVQRRKFSAFYVTSEDIGLRVGLLLRTVGWRGRLVVVVHSILSTKAKTTMRLVGRRVISEIICVSEAQRRILIAETGFPADRVHWTANWVDTDFFTPTLGRGNYVFSCGLENRDYPTLAAAACAMDVPFIVAASGFFGQGPGLKSDPPANLTVLKERVPWARLRDLYGQSRFVVLPLNSVNYGAGVTGLVEAMAMSKAVIVTASPGIAEYLVDGECGVVVPPNNPAAMAEAIKVLWDNPDRCEAIGRRNRSWVEKNAAVTTYARMASGLLQIATEKR